MKVAACVLTDNPKSESVKRIYSCLEDDMFEIYTYNVKPIDTGDKLPNKHSKKELFYQYRLNQSLRAATLNHPDDLTLIIRDDVIPSIDSAHLASCIETASRYKNWDILYLSAWGDDCSKYSKLADVPNSNLYLSKTSGPQGSSAFIVTPETRSKLINQHSPVKNKHLKSIIVLPLPFTIDPNKSTDRLDRLNLSSSSSRKNSNTSQVSVTKESSPLSIVFFLAVLLFVIALIGLLIYISRK